MIAPLLVAVVTCVGPGESTSLGGVEHRIQVNGHERIFLEYVPAQRPEKPLPVVFVFHGEGGQARVSEDYYRMNPVADEGGFLVVYPEGLEKSWDDGRGVAPGGTRGIDDVAFIRAVFEDLAQRYSVDRSRVFATGMSTGGMFCHRLAMEASDLFLAIAPVAGPIPEPLLDKFKLERPVSLYMIQGDSDPIIPLEGGFVYPRGAQRRGRISSLKDTLSKYLQASGIDGAPKIKEVEDTKDDGTKTRRSLYGPGKQGAMVQLDLVMGGGHNLPGRQRDFPEWAVGKASSDYDGPRAIWEFFKSCPPRPVGSEP